MFAFSSEREIGTRFSEVRDNYMKSNKLYRNTLQNYKSTINREDKQEEITRKKIELNKYVAELKEMIERYKKSERDEFITEVNQIYMEKIIPLVDKIRELSSSYQKIEFNNNHYNLIKNPYTIHDLETFIKQ